MTHDSEDHNPPEEGTATSMLWTKVQQEGLEPGEGEIPSKPKHVPAEVVAEVATVSVSYDMLAVARHNGEEAAHKIFTDPDFRHVPAGTFTFSASSKSDPMAQLIRNYDVSLQDLEIAGVIEKVGNMYGSDYSTSYDRIATAANAHDKHLETSGQIPKQQEGVLEPPLENFGTKLGNIWETVTGAVRGVIDKGKNPAK